MLQDAADEASASLQRALEIERKVKASSSRVLDMQQSAETARDAMRADVERSAKLVNYNAHAVHAVSGGVRYISSAAKAVRGYMHLLFHLKKHAEEHLEDVETEAEEKLKSIQKEAKAAERYAADVKDAVDSTYGNSGYPYRKGYADADWQGANGWMHASHDGSRYGSTYGSLYDRPRYRSPYHEGRYGYGYWSDGGNANPALGGYASIRSPLFWGSASVHRGPVGKGETPLVAAKELIDTVIGCFNVPVRSYFMLMCLLLSYFSCHSSSPSSCWRLVWIRVLIRARAS